MRKFVIADIHGCHRALMQCFQRSKFNYTKDLLIVLGDVVDRGPDTSKCIEELMQVQHLVYVCGNHDICALAWLRDGWVSDEWLSEGGDTTIASYKKCPKLIVLHRHFFDIAKYYYVDDNRMFIHGGFSLDTPIENQNPYDFLQNRTLRKIAFKNATSRIRLSKYREVFVGHYSTTSKNIDKPIKLCEVWFMNQGSGYPNGRLTIMNIDTHRYWQSDTMDAIYPIKKGEI